MPPDGRCGAKRLDKVSERTQLDDEDLAPDWRRRRHNPARPTRRQSIESDKAGELLKGLEHSGVLLQLDRTDAGQKAFDKLVRRRDRRCIGNARQHSHCCRECGRRDEGL